MFNLIPETYKEIIIQDYGYRRAILWSLGFLIIIISLIVYIIPSYVYIYFDKQNIHDQLEYINTSTVFKKTSTVMQNVVATNKQLHLFANAHSTVQPSGLVERAVGAKNTQIHISDIEYTIQDTATSSIVVTGIADTRDALRLYVQRLQSVPVFSSVDLPVSSFVKDVHIEFILTITSHE